MPQYTYKSESGDVITRLFKHQDRPLTIEHNGLTYTYNISTAARLVQQWAVAPFGVSGKFDVNLQAHVKDHAHKEQVMAEKGIVRSDSSLRRQIESQATAIKETRKEWRAL